MISNEACENCGRTIGRLEKAMVKDDHIVCEACYQELSKRTSAEGNLVVEDHAGSLPPKPKRPFFSITRVDFRALQRLKLVVFDPDTSELVSDNIDVPFEAPLDAVIAEVERASGRRVRKVAVLQRYWVETNEMSALEKGLFGLGVYGWLGGK